MCQPHLDLWLYYYKVDIAKKMLSKFHKTFKHNEHTHYLHFISKQKLTTQHTFYSASEVSWFHRDTYKLNKTNTKQEKKYLKN
jgi:hypothetical protein